VTQHRQVANRQAHVGSRVRPQRLTPDRPWILDDDLPVPLRDTLQERPQLVADRRGDRLSYELDRLRSPVEIVDARLLVQTLVELHRPLRLEEPLRVGAVRPQIRAGYVQAEVAERAGRSARPAASGAGDQDEPTAGGIGVGYGLGHGRGDTPQETRGHSHVTA